MLLVVFLLLPKLFVTLGSQYLTPSVWHPVSRMWALLFCCSPAWDLSCSPASPVSLSLDLQFNFC